MKIIRILIIYCLILNSAFAQDLINVKEFDPSAHYNDITPPSPTVAALNKFIETPVNYYTGVPQISIPIWQIKNKDLTHNISIDYHAGGIKVKEIASWVGLGWSLKAGGTISRNVRGLPDDRPTTGYLTSGYNFDEVELKQYNPNVDNFNLCWDAAKGKQDLEPDIFYFSVGNLSGSFVVDSKNGIDINSENIHISPLQNIIINPVIELIEGISKITGFEIVDENGIKYFFGSSEESRELTWTSTSSDWNSDPYSGTSYYSAWHLNKIQSKKTNHAIDFYYKPVVETSDNASSLVEYNRVELVQDGSDDDGTQISQVTPKIYTSASYTEQRNRTSKLTRIDFDLGKIHFESQEQVREDLKPYLGENPGCILNSDFFKFVF